MKLEVSYVWILTFNIFEILHWYYRLGLRNFVLGITALKRNHAEDPNPK